MEIPDNVEKYLPYFDAVLLESHGALTWSGDLLSAYMKMESVEFYAQLLYQSKMLGGPKEFDQATVERLYEIRRQMGLPGKHPANLCQNKGTKNCHNCGGSCSGHSGVGQHSGSVTADQNVNVQNADLVASITAKVMAQLGLQ